MVTNTKTTGNPNHGHRSWNDEVGSSPDMSLRYTRHRPITNRTGTSPYFPLGLGT